MVTTIINTYNNSILNGSYENIIKKFKIQQEGAPLKKGNLLYWNKFVKNYEVKSGTLNSISIKLREKINYGRYDIVFINSTNAKVTNPQGLLIKNDSVNGENLRVGEEFKSPSINILLDGTFSAGDEIYIYITPPQEYKLGLIKPYDPNSSFDYVGEQELFGVLLEDVDTTQEEKEALVLIKGIVNEGKVIYPQSFNLEDIILLKEEGKKKGILFI